MFRRIYIVLLAALLGACAASSPPSDAPTFSPAPQAPKGLATIYMFRPVLSDVGMVVWPIVSINGIKVAEVKSFSYTYFYAQPGTYKITTEKSQALTFLGNAPGELTIVEPKTYYVMYVIPGPTRTYSGGQRLSPPDTSALIGGDHWRLLDEAQAMQFLPGLRYLPPAIQVLTPQQK